MNSVINYLSSFFSSGSPAPATPSPAALYSILNPLFAPETATSPCSRLATAIWNSHSTATILKQLDRCTSLNKKLTAAELTPFTLAAIQENTPVMERLLQKGADINAQDFQGFSALHHMAVKGNTAGVAQLLQWKADPNIRTTNGATYQDLLRFTAPFRSKENSSLDPSLFSAHKINRETFSPVCLSQGVIAVDEMVARPEALLEVWTKKGSAIPRSQVDPAMLQQHDSVSARYAQFVKNPPRLSVEPINTDDTGKSLQIPGAFCGLRTLDPIKAGDVIAEYTGELVTEDEKKQREQNPSYLEIDFPPVDAKFYRSGASMANDAFPNAYMEGMGFDAHLQPGLSGLPKRKLIIALEDIPAGSEITISYGATHPIKTQRHIELRPQAVRDYLKKYTWQQIINARDIFRAVDTPQSRRIGAINHLRKLDYLFQTPTTFKWMAEQRIISPDDVAYIRKMNEKEPLWSNNPFRDQALRAAEQVFREEGHEL